MDQEKVRQALKEWWMTFIVLAAPAFFAFVGGVKVGDGRDSVTVFPDLSLIKAFFAAVLAAAALSFLKAVWWYITGTKIEKLPPE